MRTTTSYVCLMMKKLFKISSFYPYDYECIPETTVHLKVLSSPGYRFVGQTGSLTGSDESTDLIMDGGKYVTAVFVPIAYAMTVSVSPDAGGGHWTPSLLLGG